ncbi:MAG: DUF4367 domain-containing protein [Clostridiales bacterium]|nr:DUF4367 domain-containing protein [Clostridiales bacterium]
MDDSFGNADKPNINKSKRAFTVVIWFAVVCGICFILTSVNNFSLSDIFGSNLKNLRCQEIEKIDTEDSGFDAYSTVNEMEEYAGTKFTLPGWLPDDYVLQYVIYSDISETAVISFSSEKNEGSEIKMLAAHIIDNDEHTSWNLYVEKDDTPPYTLIHNNIEFEVFGNNGDTVICWDFNGYTYILSGVIEETEVKKIVNNIG